MTKGCLCRKISVLLRNLTRHTYDTVLVILFNKRVAPSEFDVDLHTELSDVCFALLRWQLWRKLSLGRGLVS